MSCQHQVPVLPCADVRADRAMVFFPSVRSSNLQTGVVPEQGRTQVHMARKQGAAGGECPCAFVRGDCVGGSSAETEELQLTRDDDPEKALVSFHRERRYLHVLRMSQHPYLEVHPAALESLDYIIGAPFLLTACPLGGCSSCCHSSVVPADRKAPPRVWFDLIPKAAAGCRLLA